jgi:response regulator RpfG family c-di-GMP phosphodiesterase
MTTLKKILYVDDEEINLKLFDLSFHQHFEIVTALSAEHGLEIIESDPDINLIISDLRMPGMDGLNFIKEIKSQKPSLVCLLLTGFVDSEVMLEGFNKELIYRYLTKPWKKAELLEVILNAFSKGED